MNIDVLWEAALSYDAGAVRVLRDALLEQGDARGEVIAVLAHEGFELANGSLEPGFSAVLHAKRAKTHQRRGLASWFFNESLEQMNGWFKEVYGGARPPLKWESDRVFRSIQVWLDDPEEGLSRRLGYQIPVQDSMTPENGFMYAGAPNAIEVIPSPYMRPGEALLINGQVFHAPIVDEHDDHAAAHAAALAEAINARSAAGVEAREIDGRIVLTGTPAGRISLVEHMLEHSMIYGSGAMRVVWDQAEHPIGQRLERPIVLARHRAGHRAGDSRVPPFIPQRRLDGRRAR